MIYILYLMAGVAGGLMSGLFGVGGGILIIPIFILGFGFTQHMAQGTMLATFVLPTFLFAAWKYYQAGNINIPVAIVVSIGMMAGAFIGATYAQALSGPLLQKLFGGLMVILGLRLIFF